jgi:hypothetical protein
MRRISVLIRHLYVARGSRPRSLLLSTNGDGLLSISLAGHSSSVSSLGNLANYGNEATTNIIA